MSIINFLLASSWFFCKMLPFKMSFFKHVRGSVVLRFWIFNQANKITFKIISSIGFSFQIKSEALGALSLFWVSSLSLYYVFEIYDNCNRGLYFIVFDIVEVNLSYQIILTVHVFADCLGELDFWKISLCIPKCFHICWLLNLSPRGSNTCIKKLMQSCAS